VLVDHADPGADGVAGSGELHGLAVDEDLTAGGLEDAVQHVHERGLARAVLSENRVDLSGLDHQVDLVVGDE
jgi:hypothetical protein